MLTVDGAPLGRDVITVTRNGTATGTDKWGRTLYAVVSYTVDGCDFQPLLKTREDVTGASDLVQSTWLLLAPYGCDLQAADQVDVAGVAGRFQVDGDPGIFAPDGDGDGHLEAHLIRYSG